MLRINCPHCGLRDHSEFTYQGDAKRRLMPGLSEGEERWIRYVYERDNPKGPHWELWQHTGGCRCWVEVKRDTLTHEIIASRAPSKESRYD